MQCPTTNRTGDVANPSAASELEICPVLPDRGPQLDAVTGPGQTPFTTGHPITIISLFSLHSGAHDWDVTQTGCDLPLGGHVHQRRQVDQGHGGEHGHGHAQAQRAAHHSLGTLHFLLSFLFTLLSTFLLPFSAHKSGPGPGLTFISSSYVCSTVVVPPPAWLIGSRIRKRDPSPPSPPFPSIPKKVGEAATHWVVTCARCQDL